MYLFLQLLEKLAPLYGCIVVGYVASKFLKLPKGPLAKLLLFVLAPLVSFNAVLTSPLSASDLSLPVFFFVFCSILCGLGLIVARFLWPTDSVTRGLYGFMAGEANMGFFGLPLVAGLFGAQAVSIAVLCILGYVLYESTFGYFVLARGKYSFEESLKKLIRLPIIYACILGYIGSIAHIPVSSGYIGVMDGVRVVFSFLGMALVGMAIAGITSWKFDWKFVGFALANKFVVWPLLMLGLLALSTRAGLYGLDIRHIMLTLTVTPIAATTVIFATQLNAHPEKASAAVAASTLLALVYTPVVLTLIVR